MEINKRVKRIMFTGVCFFLFSLACLQQSLHGMDHSLPCMPPTREAVKMLREMSSSVRKKQTERPFLFVRAQLKYGLERDDYLHKWLDRPLMQDTALAGNNIPGRFINEGAYRKMAEIIRMGGMDGIAFFPVTPGRSDLFSCSRLKGAELPILVELTHLGKKYFDESDLKIAELALKAPNAFRINGKVILTHAPAGNVPEYSKKLKEALRKRWGDCFLYLPYVGLRSFHPHKKLDSKAIELLKDELRTQLRAADGVFFSDRSAVWKRRFNREFEEQVILPILKSVYSEPEFKEKILGYAVAIEHSNSYRFTHTLDCTGTSFLRNKLETVRSLHPDFIIMTEWDEQNEHTHFRPTIYNSFSTQRIVRAYSNLFARRKPSPIMGDNTAIPNLIVSYRKNLTVGEPLEIEVANVPDGTFDQAIFKVTVVLKNLKGEIVKAFPDQMIHGNELANSIWFKIPSAELLEHQVILPEITVSWNEKTMNVSSSLAPIEIRANWNMDYKWVKHPLRDLPSGIKSQLSIVEKRQDGTLLLKGWIASSKKLRSVEVIEGSNVVYSHTLNGFPREDEKIVILRIAHQTGKQRSILNGSIILPDIPVAVKSDRDVKLERNRLIYQNVKMSVFPFFHYLALKKENLKDTKLIIDLPPVRGEIKIEDLLRQGIWGLSGSNGSSLVISRFHSQISIPEPFLEKKAEFSITVMPSDNKAVYSILAVDEDYKIYRGSILSLYQPNGRKRKLHAFDTDAQKMVPVLVEENLVTEFDYRFFPRYGSVVPTSAGNKYTGILGGCVPLVTGFGSGESFYGNLCGSAIHAKISGWKNQIPEYVQERNGWSLRFKDCSYLSLPLHIVPPYCGFELEIRFMPDSASEQKQTLISSGINGFNLTLENKKIYAEMFLGNRFYEQGGRYARVKAEATGVRAKEWNTVVVYFDGIALHVELNGISGRKIPCTGYLMLPRATGVGGDQFARAFFSGKIAEIKCSPK